MALPGAAFPIQAVEPLRVIAKRLLSNVILTLVQPAGSILISDQPCHDPWPVFVGIDGVVESVWLSTSVVSRFSADNVPDAIVIPCPEIL